MASSTSGPATKEDRSSTLQGRELYGERLVTTDGDGCNFRTMALLQLTRIVSLESLESGAGSKAPRNRDSQVRLWPGTPRETFAAESLDRSPSSRIRLCSPSSCRPLDQYSF